MFWNTVAGLMIARASFHRGEQGQISPQVNRVRYKPRLLTTSSAAAMDTSLLEHRFYSTSEIIDTRGKASRSQ